MIFNKNPPLARERQQADETCALDCQSDFTLAACTVAAALAGKYLPAMRKQLAQNLEVLVVNIFRLRPAEPALCLFTNIFFAFFTLVHVCLAFFKALRSH